MADTDQGDVLMYFVQREGTPPIEAESTSTLAESTSTLAGADARLMQGFVAGRFFEADNFSFSIKLADDEGGNIMNEDETREYGRWRALKEGQPKPHPPFRAEPQDVSISRKIDSSSPVLLKHCLDKKQFHTAVLVKRSRIGTTGMLSAILRMEFSLVWLRSIDWEDDDMVKETCKFKYAAVKATYVRRKPDGSVASLWPCEWTSQRAAGISGFLG